MEGCKTLYVGDLNPEISEDMLFAKFSQAGTVESIRICRDITTHRSLGYAYVNFADHESAQKAFALLNYEPMNDKPCRLMWLDRNPSLRKSAVGNVFVKNLEKSIDSEQLYNTFSNFGNILSCKVEVDNNGSKGYGFVHFENVESAETCISKLNGMLLNDKKIFVGSFIPKVERLAKMKEQPFNNLYVKNFDPSLSDEQFLDYFKEFGAVLSHKVMRHDDGTSKGFGLISFKGHQNALDALQTMNGKLLENGRVLYVARAQKKSERAADLALQKREKESHKTAKVYPGVSLVVKNLPVDVDENMLKSEFEKMGNVLSVAVKRGDNGISKGTGFVSMSTQEEAHSVISEWNGRVWKDKRLLVAVFIPKEKFNSRQNPVFGFYRPSSVPSLPHGSMPSFRNTRVQPVHPNMNHQMLYSGASGFQPYVMPAIPQSSLIVNPQLGNIPLYNVVPQQLN